MTAHKSATFQTISLDIGDRIARLTINRPPLNILDLNTLHEIEEAVESVKKSHQIQVLTISGSGEKAFSAGADVKDHTPARVSTMLHEFHHVILKLRELPITTIAVVRGLALGGGCELVLACDLILAEECAQFGQPEINLGCFPPMACAFLPELVGKKKAYEIVVLGRHMTAMEAFQMGLINKVVPKGQLDETVKEWCKEILEKSSKVISITKEALNTSPGLTFSQALERVEDIYINHLMKTEDGVEGINAYLEKRKPVWKGC